MSVALVCGGGGALGSEIVRSLVARGDAVVVVDRAPAEDALPGVTHEVADLTSAEEVAALWDRLTETPRWVVNSAGGFRVGDVASSDPESVRFMSDLNLGTAWWSCHEAARRLPEGGAIVNVSSKTGLTGGAGSAAYAVAKSGVIRLTEVLAAELRERRIRVNAVLPSVIDTPANRASMSPDQLKNAVAPADLASVIDFLLSEAAAAVTGAIVPVYGFG